LSQVVFKQVRQIRKYMFPALVLVFG